MRLPPHLRAALAPLLLAGAVAPLARAQYPPRDLDGLLQTLELDGSPEQVERLARELALDPRAARWWIEVTAAGALTAGPQEAPRPLVAAQVELLARAAPLLDRTGVLRAATPSAERPRDRAWRRAALDLLRWHATASELPLLLELAQVAPGEEAEAGEVLVALREAAVATIRRDAGTIDELSALAVLPRPQGAELVRAVGLAGVPEGLTWLATQLDDVERLDVALQEIGRLAHAAPPEDAREVAESVRRFLGSEEPSRRRRAAGTLAALRDDKAIPGLVVLMESPLAGDVRAAWSALRQLTGRDLPQDAAAWRGWLGSELRWWGREAEATLARLGSEDDAEVVAALREASGHGLLRDRIALELVPLLRREGSAAVRGQACLGLARLGSETALDALVGALEDPDKAVRAHACTALRAITGLSLEADPAVWTAAVAAAR